MPKCYIISARKVSLPNPGTYLLQNTHTYKTASTVLIKYARQPVIHNQKDLQQSQGTTPLQALVQITSQIEIPMMSYLPGICKASSLKPPPSTGLQTQAPKDLKLSDSHTSYPAIQWLCVICSDLGTSDPPSSLSSLSPSSSLSSSSLPGYVLGVSLQSTGPFRVHRAQV